MKHHARLFLAHLRKEVRVAAEFAGLGHIPGRSTKWVKSLKSYPKLKMTRSAADAGLPVAVWPPRRQRMTALERQNKQDTRRVPVFARTVFRHLQDQGYTREQIIGVSTEILNLLHDDLKTKGDFAPAE
ncbi:hypothetical protein [Plesiocystis pacifica]|nr:hypothetical protein [Plesiocystis pacifica]